MRQEGAMMKNLGEDMCKRSALGRIKQSAFAIFFGVIVSVFFSNMLFGNENGVGEYGAKQLYADDPASFYVNERSHNIKKEEFLAWLDLVVHDEGDLKEELMARYVKHKLAYNMDICLDFASSYMGYKVIWWANNRGLDMRQERLKESFIDFTTTWAKLACQKGESAYIAANYIEEALGKNKEK